MLRAGHNIASSQKEYQGIDFRKVSWEYLVCRGKRNPTFCCGAPGEDRQSLRCNVPLKCQHCAFRASMFHSVLVSGTTCHAVRWQGDVSRSTPLPSAHTARVPCRCVAAAVGQVWRPGVAAGPAASLVDQVPPFSRHCFRCFAQSA